MFSSNIAIRVNNLSKRYEIYENPRDRLKQFILPRLQRLTGQPPKQYFQEFWALKDVSFEVEKGETVGIVGRNGSGKSTLLQIICGTLSATSGNGETYGRIAALLELGAGFNSEFTGRENVYMNGAVLGLSKDEIDERFEGIAAFAEIGDFIEQPVKTYSTGMFVRLAFAIQANVDPEILVVDEALAVGDAYFVHKCMLRFNQLREAGTTILFVSHDATAIKTLCNRAIWISHGEVASFGASSQVVDKYLSSLTNQLIVVDYSDSVRREDLAITSEEGIHNEVGEYEIPNIDRRLGDQSCIFVGLGLYNDEMQRTTALDNDSTAVLRVTIKNLTLKDHMPLILGYSLRNHRGVDIASNNSEIEKAVITAPKKDQQKTIRIRIHLPTLHPGSYSISVSLSYRLDSGKAQNVDAITNAVVFDILSQKLVHVLLSLKTDFEEENK